MSGWADLLLAPPPDRPLDPSSAPTLSVVVPVYNAADTIGEALESALTQRPAPFEVIVSDDGSEDALDAVLAGFGNRVRLVRGPNRGVATARNRAASVAHGDLLGLLDADDVWLPGRAAALTEAAGARPDLSILTTDAVVVRDGEPSPGSYYASRTFDVQDQAAAILRSNFVLGAGAVRARALAEAGGYNPVARWAEDWDLWLRLILRGHRAGLVQAPLYEYRRREGSLTRQRIDLALGVAATLERARPLVKDPGAAAVLRQSQQEWQLRAVREAWAGRDRRRVPLTVTRLLARHPPGAILPLLGELARSARRRLPQ